MRDDDEIDARAAKRKTSGQVRVAANATNLRGMVGRMIQRVMQSEGRKVGTCFRSYQQVRMKAVFRSPVWR